MAGRDVNRLPVGHRDRRGRRTELRRRHLQHHHLSVRPHRARNRVPHIGTEPSGVRFTLQCQWQGGTNIGEDSTWAIKCDRNGSSAAGIYLVKFTMRTFPDLHERTQEGQLGAWRISTISTGSASGTTFIPEPK